MGKRELLDKRNWLHNSIESYRKSKASTEDQLKIARADCENYILVMRSAEESWRDAKFKRDELIASINYINDTIADSESEIREIEYHLTRIGIEEAVERKEVPQP